MEGRTLENLLAAERRLSVARALHIAVHVLRGLEQKHVLGTVYGKLATRNVRLGKRLGDPDFAELLDGDGQPGYAVPEQDAGEEIDHRADLYGASAMLFEMLTGTPYGGGDTMPRLSEVAAGVEVPPEVELLLRRGLARQPELRPSCAGEYATQLDMLLKAHRRVIAEPTMLLGSADPSPAPPPQPAPPPPQQRAAPPPPQPPAPYAPIPLAMDRRRQVVIATMIGVIVLLAAVIGGVLAAP